MSQILRPEKCSHNPNILRYLHQINPIEQEGFYRFFSDSFDVTIVDEYKSKLNQIMDAIKQSGAERDILRICGVLPIAHGLHFKKGEENVELANHVPSKFGGIPDLRKKLQSRMRHRASSIKDEENVTWRKKDIIPPLTYEEAIQQIWPT